VSVAVGCGEPNTSREGIVRERERRLREGVYRADSVAAKHPGGDHPFPVGRQFAQSLGYPSHLLDGLPPVSVEAFSGVSNVALFAQLSESATVLDLGCGAGLDSLISSRRLGPRGCVIGADFSEAMLRRASRGIWESRVRNVELLRAAAENLPLADASIDVVLVNGIFNLKPARKQIFQELARVVRPGGEIDAAELILKEPLPPEVHKSEAEWFA
jgi:SAM-dependent methyltransferase